MSFRCLQGKIDVPEVESSTQAAEIVSRKVRSTAQDSRLENPCGRERGRRRSSRRAVSDALPLLKAAENVMVVEIVEGGTDLTPQAGEDVARYLNRHGIEIVVERQRPADVTAANSLLRLIEDENISLIMGGAYGHSRLGEWAFGGVTRDLS